jgi:hypothetical protein
MKKLQLDRYQKMLKVLLFKKCRMISDPYMRKFAVLALKSAPDYFWTEPASTSGKYHAGETLVEHVLFCLIYGKDHIRMIQAGKNPWNDKQISIFYTALICHDLFRSGMPGRELRDKDGKLRTDDLHTIYAPRALKFLNLYVGNEDKTWYAKNNLPWAELEDAMAGHYGPWSPILSLDPTVDRVFQDVSLHVFLVDYVVSRGCLRVVSPEIDELRRNMDLYNAGEIDGFGIPKGYPENTKDWNRIHRKKEAEERFKKLYGDE